MRLEDEPWFSGSEAELESFIRGFMPLEGVMQLKIAMPRRNGRLQMEAACRDYREMCAMSRQDMQMSEGPREPERQIRLRERGEEVAKVRHETLLAFWAAWKRGDI